MDITYLYLAGSESWIVTQVSVRKVFEIIGIEINNFHDTHHHFGFFSS
ncbi:hypothetical protein FLM9_1562 [Candidatus Synechococcus spongiarum]|uniref:Uncharacterized protein n=1 Tax=Candidatus Synechococcus spongiarum TaxID=431041 RepID=A0A170TG36_9SYNE|nr:hypothetical protein FLM9_1562 [Candidatus Synechococcus spongiarum]